MCDSYVESWFKCSIISTINADYAEGDLINFTNMGYMVEGLLQAGGRQYQELDILEKSLKSSTE